MSHKVIAIIIIIIASACFGFVSVYNNPVDKKVTVNDKPQNLTIIYLKNDVSGFTLINKTNITSLVVSTKTSGNYTEIQLANSLSLLDKSNTVKSGNILSLNFSIYKPNCMIIIQTGNKTLDNNTEVKLVTKSNPVCYQNASISKLESWKLVNAK